MKFRGFIHLNYQQFTTDDVLSVFLNMVIYSKVFDART